jgi:hypothetical protein
MKIEVLTTLKGNIGEMFEKGSIFESPHIPQTIMEELGANRGLVRVLEEDITPVVIIEIPVVAPPTIPKEVHAKKHPRIKR